MNLSMVSAKFNFHQEEQTYGIYLMSSQEFNTVQSPHLPFLVKERVHVYSLFDR